MTCKDCLKKELGYCKFDCTEPQRCEDFKHKSEWVHLPCNVGAEVFTLIEDDEDGDFVNGGVVVSVSYQTKCWIYVRYECGLTYYHTTDDIGKSLFFTREEAERALSERSNV